MTTASNTLLVFAKQPIPGRVKTRLGLHLGADAACQIYQAFLHDVVHQLCGLENTRIVWHVDGDPDSVRSELDPQNRYDWDWVPQIPGDLGQRLAAALGSAFRVCPAPVAVIGSDCPLLGSRQIMALFSHLEEHCDAAVLPAEDGGYAGLALSRPCPQAFRKIPWSSPDTLRVTLQRLKQAGFHVAQLPPVFDVDGITDLQRLRRFLRDQPFLAPHSSRAIELLPESLES